MPLTDSDLQRMRAIVEVAAQDGLANTMSEDRAISMMERCLDEIERLRTALFELAEEMVGNLHPNHRRDELEMGWTGRLLALVHPDGVAQWQAWREKAGRG